MGHGIYLVRHTSISPFVNVWWINEWIKYIAGAKAAKMIIQTSCKMREVRNAHTKRRKRSPQSRPIRSSGQGSRSLKKEGGHSVESSKTATEIQNFKYKLSKFIGCRSLWVSDKSYEASLEKLSASTGNTLHCIRRAKGSLQLTQTLPTGPRPRLRIPTL